jgi:uncharacterized membrane protein
MKTTYTKGQKLMEIAGAVLMATYIFFMLIIWADVPELIPVHFDISGMADRWGSRVELVVVFFVAILLYAGLTWITRHPQLWNVPSAKDAVQEAHVYRTTKSMIIALKVEILVTFFYISVSQVMAWDLHPAYLPSYLTVLFGTLAFFLVGMYRIPKKEV